MFILKLYIFKTWLITKLARRVTKISLTFQLIQTYQPAILLVDNLVLTLLISRDQWPSPLPEFDIVFSDGCVPATLHNSSDCPSNFPTLDTLPRDRRNEDYSEAYDGENNENKGAGSLMISPAVMYLMGATPKTNVSATPPSQRHRNVSGS